MIFREWNGAYYKAVSQILKVATCHPVTNDEMRNIIRNYAFSESILSIEPSLTEGKWQLLSSDGTTPLLHTPTMPLSLLQRQWLKAISLDPRIRLFDFDTSEFQDVPPLFEPDDIYFFDRYSDGDHFEDENYIATFRLILDAVKNRYPLKIDVKNRKGSQTHLNVMPDYLEYSEKDDKFRLITSGCRYGKIINVGRILSCKPYDTNYPGSNKTAQIKSDRSVVIELSDERNALDRVFLHFAHFEKQAEKMDEKHYRVRIFYNQDDETEMVIRVLSFGPFVRVVEPEPFIELIKKRLILQKSCEII